MSKTSKAKVTVDLTPINKGVIDCDACIDFNSMDQPEAITVVVDGLDAQQINHFCKSTLAVKDVLGNPAVTGVLETSDGFEGVIAFIKRVSFGAASVQLECYLGAASRGCGIAPKEPGQGHWVFGLSNYRVFIGDQRTEVPIPAEKQITPEMAEEFNALKEQWHEAFPNSGIPKSPPVTPADITLKPGWRNNRITLTFAGRIWTLDDDLLGRWPTDDSKITGPIRSGTLSTEWKDGDVEGVLQQAADDIAELLSLALGRDIKWVQFGRKLVSSDMESIHYRKPGLLALKDRGSRLADNWEVGNLKRFVECGEKEITTDSEWWSKTIGLLTQARGAKYLEVKCSLLNTLLDRVTTRIIGPATNAEIEAGLKAKVDDPEFRKALHAVLSSLTDKWEITRTNEICRTINDWNVKPSFPKKIIRCCQKLGIPPISGTKLGFRHVLIHEGEMHSDLENIEERAAYYVEIEAILLLLLVRMLGFDGFIYLQSNPPDPKKVSEFLAETPESNGGK